MTPSTLHSRAATTLATLLVLLHAAPANAAPGIGVSWNHCQGEVGAAQNREFACDTNTGQDIAYGTLALGSPVADLGGIDMTLQLVAASPTLPAWWQFATGNCRVSSMSSPQVIDPAATLCQDWAAGLASPAFFYCSPTAACGDPSQPPNTARIFLGAFVPLEQPQVLAADQLYFVVSQRLNHAKTVGAGSCAGCETPVCMVFTSAVLRRFSAPNPEVTAPSFPGGNVITWGGGVAGVPGCLAATPTLRSTWGSVKSLYR
jgi:hypothetical protein